MSLDKNQIKKLILQELDSTKSQIDDLKELTKPIEPDCAIGRISRMDAINNKSINEATLRKAEVKYSGLNFALSRIDDADFGACARCEQPIPVGRLMLVPHSRFCARCAD